MKSAFFFLFTIFFLQFALARAIPVYSFHKLPPFYFEEERQQGLTELLVKLLNEESKKKKLPYEFEHHFVPRKRVVRTIKEGGELVFLHTNPVFLNLKKTKYFWSTPYLRGADLVISDKSSPYEFEGFTSLKMDCIVTIRGYSYPYLNEAIQKKMLSRYDVEAPESIVGMIQKKRCRAGIVPKIYWNYLHKTDQAKIKSIHISKQGIGQFDRQVLSTSKDKQLNRFLEDFTVGLKTEPQWQKALQDFGTSIN